jgi:hypothetical protein
MRYLALILTSTKRFAGVFFALSSINTGVFADSRRPEADTIEVSALSLTLYSQRLSFVEELGRTYRALFIPSPAQAPLPAGSMENSAVLEQDLDQVLEQSLGIWFGIYKQTLWQQNTLRSAWAIWNEVNAFLTTAPYMIAKGVRLVDEGRSEGRLTQMVEAWQRYFSAIKTERRPRELQKLMWKAHAASIHYVIRRFQKKLCGPQGSRAELDFWQGWVGVVDALALAGFPTSEQWVDPIAKMSFPKCAPLEALNCRLGDLPPLEQGFVRTVSYWGRLNPTLRCRRR